MVHEERVTEMFLRFFFLPTDQRTCSGFVRGFTKMAEAEGSFEERFSETVRYFLVIYMIMARFH